MSGAIIAVTADGAVSHAVILWRYHRRLQMTIVVKAEFALAHAVEAAHVGPGEIVFDDRARPDAAGFVGPTDAVPYRPRCDVTFVGQAYAPEGRPSPGASARLGIARDAPLLDKSLHVFGDRAAPAAPPKPFTAMPLTYERALGGVGHANPIGTERPNVIDARDPTRPGGFGPIPWLPPRLGWTSQSAMRVVDFPDSMHWETFQFAPPDQQIDYLKGGEWLILDGLHPTLARIQTRLPTVRPVVRVTAPIECMVPLVCDTLHIDGMRNVLALAWRGSHEVVGGEGAIGATRVSIASGITAPTAASSPPPPPASAREPERLVSTAAAQKPFGTLTLDIGAQANAAAKPVAPFRIGESKAPSGPNAGARAPWFEPGPAPPLPRHPLEGTLPADAVFAKPIPGDVVGEAEAAARAEARTRAAAAPPATSPTPARAEEASRSPAQEALESKLRAAGAGSDDLAALLSALKPSSK